MATELKDCPICMNGNIETDEMDLLGTGETCMHAICHECGASAPVDKWNERAELDDRGKQSFFSGLAVALQAVCMFDEPTVAKEIVDGLGGEIDEFSQYMKDEGGVDAETLDWMVGNGIVRGEYAK